VHIILLNNIPLLFQPECVLQSVLQTITIHGIKIEDYNC